ncbi:MAG TPA: hypothetical protein VGS20_15610 [Candidatus Acidoferrales bacterium]|nr:hypothetical protein [Candidatus Acidoferrales bacterium]
MRTAHIRIFGRTKGNPKKRKPLAVVTVRGASRKKLAANVTRVMRHHLKNVKARARVRRGKNIEMGFWDGTGFHPIRASRDYSERRAKSPASYGRGGLGGGGGFKRSKKKYRGMPGRRS